ncbi:MAG: hypothetical protein N4A49_06885 [Marinifilaceae bacterium]|jgi:hypothetical protein|nr:hypothetical protein [Marinifilaceae bacterium]
MKTFSLKRIIAVIFIFSAFYSCKSDSDDVDFGVDQLKDKYWYSNLYVNGDYDTPDEVLVYKFSSNANLIRQDFGGRVDDIVGSWQLSGDELEINDKLQTSNQQWTVQSSSNSNQLIIKNVNGTRTFFTDNSLIQDITADAYIVQENIVENSAYVSKLYYGVDLIGKNIKSAKALFSKSESYNLTKYVIDGISHWRISDKKYLTNFDAAKTVKFVVTLSNNEKISIKEEIENVKLPLVPENGFSVSVTSKKVTVNWDASSMNSLNNVFYRVEFFKTDENETVYKSEFQPVDKDAAIQTIELEETDPSIFGIPLGESFKIKLIAFKFEDGINAYQSSNKEYNVQAQSVFIKGASF